MRDPKTCGFTRAQIAMLKAIDAHHVGLPALDLDRRMYETLRRGILVQGGLFYPRLTLAGMAKLDEINAAERSAK